MSKDPMTFFTLIISANIAAYVLTIAIGKLWNKIHRYKETLSNKELKSSLIVLLVNILISIPGFILWNKGIIVFSDSRIWVSFLVLFLLMDFLMYVFHYLSHTINFFKKIHAKHHEHKHNFNSISLYHMSPWEAILFGLLVTLIVFLFEFNIYGFIAYLIFNWLYGVMTHLNGNSRNTFLFFTTKKFHKAHHRSNTKNFGFYTIFWDRLFKTEMKK